MIFGSYPCCDAPLAIAVPDKTPAYFSEACPQCGAKVWHRLSRIDPESWTEAEFLAGHEVDEARKTIRSKNPEPELDPELKAELAKFISDWVLFGESKANPRDMGLFCNVVFGDTAKRKKPAVPPASKKWSDYAGSPDGQEEYRLDAIRAKALATRLRNAAKRKKAE